MLAILLNRFSLVNLKIGGDQRLQWSGNEAVRGLAELPGGRIIHVYEKKGVGSRDCNLNQSLYQKTKHDFLCCSTIFHECSQISLVIMTPERSFAMFQLLRVSYCLHTASIYGPSIGYPNPSLSTPRCLLPPPAWCLHLRTPVLPASSDLYIVLRATIQLVPCSRLV